MWRFHKICCYLGQHPKRKGSISPSKFDGQLSHILFTHICLCVGVLGLLVCCCSLFSSQTSSSSSLPVICQFYEPERKWISGWSPVITVILWGRRERLKQCQPSQDSVVLPWGSLNWLNGWVRENVFGADCWDVRRNKKMKNWWGIEEGSANEGCKNDFVNKWRWNREVKII